MIDSWLFCLVSYASVFFDWPLQTLYCSAVKIVVVAAATNNDKKRENASCSNMSSKQLLIIEWCIVLVRFNDNLFLHVRTAIFIILSTRGLRHRCMMFWCSTWRQITYSSHQSLELFPGETFEVRRIITTFQEHLLLSTAFWRVDTCRKLFAVVFTPSVCGGCACSLAMKSWKVYELSFTIPTNCWSFQVIIALSM